MKQAIMRLMRGKKRGMVMGACLLTAAVLLISGGFMSYADVQERGQYVDVQEGYILRRLDAQETCTVKLPADTCIPADSGSRAAVLKKIAARPVTLHYDHSEKGSTCNWDVYEDEEGNSYTYHEMTGQMVSIQFQKAFAAERDTSTFYTEEEIHAFAEQYLRALVPRFGLYELASSYFAGHSPEDPNARYILDYGVRIGDYFSGDDISVTCRSTGELMSISFPRSTLYEELSTQEKEKLAARLPAREEVEAYILEQMQEKYGDQFLSMEINSSHFYKEGADCMLTFGVGIRTPTASYFESVMYPVE
ncbi:MAG: hypothetical protein HFJ80_06865 [Clostridiales bacterium]|nr:hypothetical protein [Clostridiales bacterium]